MYSDRRIACLRRHLGRLCILAVGISATVVAQAEQRVHVKFDPPDGTTFVMTVRIEKTIQQGGMPSTAQRSEMKSEFTIRRTAAGYSVYEKPVMPVDLKVPVEAADLAAGLISNMNLRYDLDKHGNLKHIEGLETAFGSLESVMPEEMLMAMKAMRIDAGWLRQQTTAAWKLRPPFDIAALSGHDLAPGTEREVPDATYLSALGALFKATGHLTTSNLFDCEARRCIRIVSVAETSDPALGQPLMQQMRDAIAGVLGAFASKDEPMPEIPKLGIRDVHEKVRLVRVFEPASGLHHQYLEEHELTVTFVVEERTGTASMPMKISLRHEHSYAYQ